ncbi:MAG: hypothetical protein IPJ88_08390 [Myxococcales bacterium]|nr:MAG: hypothetical protein IPJ88_08390 [Myxococcales bacterium]
MQTLVEDVLWLLGPAGLIVIHVLVFGAWVRRIIPLVLLLDVVAFVLFATSLFSLHQFDLWMAEDAWVEWGTFFSFFAVLPLVAWQLYKEHQQERSRDFLSQLALIALSLFCVFIAGEEISWGQRLFALKPPDYFLAHNFQQELNLHNLVAEEKTLGQKIDTRYFVAALAVLYGVLIPLLRLSIERFWKPIGFLSAVAPSLFLLPYFACVALMELIYPLQMGGEAAEFGLGLLFLCSAILIQYGEDDVIDGFKDVIAIVTPFVASLLLAIVTPPLLEATLWAEDEQKEKRTLAELELLKRDFLGEHEGQELLRGGFIHKRIFTGIEEGWLRWPKQSAFVSGGHTKGQSKAAVEARRNFYIDPWNNPYWYLYHRKLRVLVIYSFGANRKRDTQLEHHPLDVVRHGMHGDDLAVAVRLSWK